MHATPRGRRPVGLALALLVAAMLPALAGCGDDASDETRTGAAATGADTPTSTALDPTGGTPTIPDLPQNDDPEMVVCTGTPQTDSDGRVKGVFDATAVVGDSLAKAEKAAARQGCQVRVAVIDGEPQALTEDYRPDRVNVALENDEVTEILSIG